MSQLRGLSLSNFIRIFSIVNLSNPYIFYLSGCPEKKEVTSLNDPIGIRPSPQQKPSATGELRQRRCAVLGRHRRLMEASNDPLVCHISGGPPLKKKEMTARG